MKIGTNATVSIGGQQLKVLGDFTVTKSAITIEELNDSYDWEATFGEASGCSANNKTDECPPGSKVDRTPPTRADVEEIIAAVNGENDGDSWLGVFKLKDGRYLVASGWCDYTGWG